MVCLACHPPERKAQQPLFVFLPVYPELVSVVGSTVPDYRGIFLRGHGSQTSTHYGAVVHSSAGLGQLQGGGIREISGLVSGTSNRGVFGRSYGGLFLFQAVHMVLPVTETGHKGIRLLFMLPALLQSSVKYAL